MRLIIVRHAETFGNLKHVLSGRGGTRLTKRGVAQAENLSKRISKEKIDIVYCSPLYRCRQTLMHILKNRKVKVIYSKILEERDWGIFEGKHYTKLKTWLLSFGDKPNYTLRVPKGESFQDVKNRVNIFLSKLLKQEKGKTVLIVTHGAVKTAILLKLLNKTEKTHYMKFKPGNTALSIISIKDNGKHKAHLINSTKHLEGKR